MFATITHHEPATLLHSIFRELLYKFHMSPVDRGEMTGIVVADS